MLKMRDLGINALPRNGPRMAACPERTENCEGDSRPPDCNGCTSTFDPRCGEYTGGGDRPDCDGCTATGKPDRYHAATFTDDAVTRLRQQLDQQLGY